MRQFRPSIVFTEHTNRFTPENEELGAVRLPRAEPEVPPPPEAFATAVIAEETHSRRRPPQAGPPHFPKCVNRIVANSLANAGYAELSDLDGASVRSLLRLAGMGPRTLEGIRVELTAIGKSFAP